MIDSSNRLSLPERFVGPIKIVQPFHELISVPLATYETTLWPSVARGARLSREGEGIRVQVISQAMSRSILIEAPTAIQACELEKKLISEQALWQEVISKTSRFAKLTDLHSETVGPLIFLRLAFSTGDAAGHNMATKASESVLNFILERYPQLRYVSLSGNYCTDKKVSAINGLLGRGFRVAAEMIVSRKACLSVLKTTPEAIIDLHIKKNLIGSILAGSLRSANAHFANMLLAFFLSTGQDGANIVEGSQGMTHASLLPGGELSFSCTLPSLVIGSVGHGKKAQGEEPLQSEQNLIKLGCRKPDLAPGQGAERLAVLAASVVLCGEISLLAALTNPGELMRAHTHFERKGYPLENDPS